jgi:hypothetical protein
MEEQDVLGVGLARAALADHDRPKARRRLPLRAGSTHRARYDGRGLRQ